MFSTLCCGIPPIGICKMCQCVSAVTKGFFVKKFQKNFRVFYALKPHINAFTVKFNLDSSIFNE
jgi:hypothetical protein